MLTARAIGQTRLAKADCVWETVDSTTAGMSGWLDAFNRQLHPDERKWAKDNAKPFAAEYEKTTGQAITAEQAETLLLANGYRLVDATANKGPGGDAAAVAYISQNAGSLFTATASEYNNPFLNGNRDGSLTPEQKALPGHEAHPAVGLGIAAGVTGGLAIGPEAAAGLVAAAQACAANPVLCMNQAGIAAGEVVAGGAMPAGTGAAVTGAATVAEKAVEDAKLGRGAGIATDAKIATHNDAGFDTSNLESKLAEYLLNPAHPQNQTKANWFNQALGFNQDNWQGLASQLRFDSTKAVLTKVSQYGKTYEQLIPIMGANGKTINTTFVFMQDKAGIVRLVTGIPARK